MVLLNCMQPRPPACKQHTCWLGDAMLAANSTQPHPLPRCGWVRAWGGGTLTVKHNGDATLAQVKRTTGGQKGCGLAYPATSAAAYASRSESEQE